MLPTLVVPSFIGLWCQVCPPLLANLLPSSPPSLPSHSQLQVTLSSVTLETELSRVESLGREASHEPRYHRIVPGPKAQAVWLGAWDEENVQITIWREQEIACVPRTHLIFWFKPVLYDVWKSQTKGGFELLQWGISTEMKCIYLHSSMRNWSNEFPTTRQTDLCIVIICKIGLASQNCVCVYFTMNILLLSTLYMFFDSWIIPSKAQRFRHFQNPKNGGSTTRRTLFCMILDVLQSHTVLLVSDPKTVELWAAAK